MTRRARAAAVLAGCAAMGVVATVAAEDEPVALEWIAPAECPDAGYVERELGRLLAGDPVAAERRLRARAEVGRSDGGWRVRIRTSGAGGAGDRTLDAPTCRAIADATALIVALAVDPARVAANRASASASATPTATATAPATPTPTATATAPATPIATAPATPTATPPAIPPSAPPTQLSLGLSGVVDSATLPHATPGGALRFGVRPGFASWLRVEGAAALFASASTGAGTARGGDFSLYVLGLGACAPVALGAWEIAPCASGEAARIGGSGDGPSAPSRGGAWMPRVLVGGDVALRLAAWFFLRADLAAGVALARPEFTVGGFDAGLVHEPAALTARAGLGLELRF